MPGMHTSRGGGGSEPSHTCPQPAAAESWPALGVQGLQSDCRTAAAAAQCAASLLPLLPDRPRATGRGWPSVPRPLLSPQSLSCLRKLLVRLPSRATHCNGISLSP